MKPDAGWTGTQALRYSGGHTAEGRGYAYDKVFDVDLDVTADSQLSYLIFPELTNGDLGYPSTYAAVDLAFTDGTYLSDLDSVDPDPQPARRLGADHPRHELDPLVLARQQPPRHRGPARLQLLDADDRRELDELALRLPAGQQRRQPAGDPGLRRLARAEPVD